MSCNHSPTITGESLLAKLAVAQLEQLADMNSGVFPGPYANATPRARRSLPMITSPSTVLAASPGDHSKVASMTFASR